MNSLLISNALGYNNVYDSVINYPRIKNYGQIIIISKKEHLDAILEYDGVLYICTPGMVDQVILSCDRKVNVICAGSIVDTEKYHQWSLKINLFFCNLDISSAFNAVSEFFAEYSLKLYAFNQLVAENVTVKPLLAYIANQSCCSIFLTDDKFQILNREYYSDIKFFSSTSEKLWNVFTESSSPDEDSIAEIKKKNDDYHCETLVRNNKIVGYLIVFHHIAKENRSFFSEELLISLCRQLVRFLHRTRYYESTDAPVESLLISLLERKIDSEATAKKIMRQSNISLPNPYICMVVEFESPVVSPQTIRMLAASFKSFINRCYSLIYNDRIILIVPSDKDDRPDFDTEKFNSLLSHYNARAGISFISRFYLSMTVLFQEASSALRFGLIFAPQNRMHFFNDYQIYQMIELCSRQENIAFHNNNPLYLSSPATLKLKKYDIANDDNLYDTLFAFLKNNMSITHTANELFIHRNTLTYKIEKIKEILGNDLSDYSFCLSLQITYFVVNYIEKVLHRDPFDERRSTNPQKSDDISD